MGRPAAMPCSDGRRPPDRQHYYLDNPASSDLATVFTLAATELVQGGSHLIQLYPIPVVTAACGPNQRDRGMYFTGAGQVFFGNAPVSFTVSSDNLITITSALPTHTSGTIVDVTVQTGNGTSVITSASNYTYP